MDTYNEAGDNNRKIKELEAELGKEKEEKQDLLDIIDTLESQIFRCQKDKDNEYIITFNEGNIAQFNHITTSKIKNKRIRDIIGEDLYSHLEPYYDQAFAGKKAKYRGFEFNGHLYSTVLTPFKKDEKGNVTEAVGITHEVTEQYNIERKYRKEKDILDRIIEHNPYSIQILDAEGHHLRKNKAFEEMFKAAPGGNWSIFKDQNLLSSGLQDQLAQLFEGKVIKMPPVWYNTHKVNEKYPDNPICLGSVIFPIFLSDGTLEHIVVMHEDITERIKAKEELIIAKEKAEESDRLKSSFLANLSHEIRTPMNGIFGFAELLREKNIDEDEKAEYIDVIEESGKRMMNIIEDLVNISSIESGQMQVSKEKTNINEVLEYLHQSFELKIEQRNVKLRMHVKSSAQPLYINTDKEKLHIIINNLLKNAFRFTEQGTIDFGYHLDNEKNNIEFYVKDTGIGIAPEQQQAIFKRFVQVDTSLSRDHEGAGLGLSIAKAYVEILGGKIWVESEKEKGSVFYFTIPLENEDQDKLTSGKQGNKFKSINKDATILVCDDDEVSLKYFEDMFAGESINLLIARNGKEAIELCKHHQNIQLVFMDTKMPVIDGVTAAQYIKESNPKMPIIALPAFALESEKRKFGDMFDSYITKPVEKDLVMETINKFLSTE
ncbi:MAG: response regulator [Bacteroidales bacterium]|nr:response regulator [Bacteroidales bacterium]MCF8328072.1 response regulator [Bacteroidales bacterium]